MDKIKRTLDSRALLAAGLVLAALAVAAIRFAPGGGASPAGPPEKLTLALAEQPAMALIYVAEAQGFFRGEGLELRYNKFALGRDAIVDAIEGRADLATAYELPVAVSLYKGHDLAILTTLHSSTRSHAVLARRDRGIAGPADLRGERIGVTPGTTMDYFLNVFLAGEGIAPGAIAQIPLEPADYEAALLGGRVDALVVFNPHLYSLRRKLGPERAVLFYSSAYTEFSLLVGRRDIVTARAEAVRRLLRALVRAEAFVRINREQSIAIVAAALAGRHSEESIREGWETLRHEARLNHLLLTVLSQEGNWLRDSGRFQTPVPDFGRALLRDPLAEADPGAVTLLAAPVRP